MVPVPPLPPLKVAFEPPPTQIVEPVTGVLVTDWATGSATTVMVEVLFAVASHPVPVAVLLVLYCTLVPAVGAFTFVPPV